MYFNGATRQVFELSYFKKNIAEYLTDKMHTEKITDRIIAWMEFASK